MRRTRSKTTEQAFQVFQYLMRFCATQIIFNSDSLKHLKDLWLLGTIHHFQHFCANVLRQARYQKFFTKHNICYGTSSDFVLANLPPLPFHATRKRKIHSDQSLISKKKYVIKLRQESEILPILMHILPFQEPQLRSETMQ